MIFRNSLLSVCGKFLNKPFEAIKSSNIIASKTKISLSLILAHIESEI